MRGDTAGIVSRGLAAVVDFLVATGLGLALELAAGCARMAFTGPPFKMPDLPGWATVLGGWVIAVLYLTAGWAMVGRTVGTGLMGLRVARRTGRPVKIPRALLRAVLCVTFPWGLLWVPFSRRDASLQDLLTSTAVRYDPP
ncbi:RDD family protein [Streptomyces mangrovisoli]|uniref:RDD family protein n=1 Tax=Streptomyces mangrovisoli TaxID=1428628 RepID=A0A1J4NQE7_9ACTN|nr:RDD family protein [Streptomyces mangrovisoli]